MDILSKNNISGSKNHSNLPSLFQSESSILEILFNEKFVTVFFKGNCFFTYEPRDKFSRNYCIVQLHLSGKIKLKYLSERFNLSYPYCSKILNQFKEFGLEGLKEKIQLSFSNRKVINDEIGFYILAERKKIKNYDEISNQIRFIFKKRVSSRSIANWVSKYNKKDEKKELSFQVQLEMDCGQEFFAQQQSDKWNQNIYAGSFILYIIIEQTGLFKIFEENLNEDMYKRKSSSGVRRVILTIFFLHALRLKSIEQSKFLVEKDFSQVVGGSFLRVQSLRYAIDKIIEERGFEQAINSFYEDLLCLTERKNQIYYTDGHFSNYYGVHNVPKGYDPRRQQPSKGRTSIYLHNSEGEIAFYFESVINTTLSNDIETLINEVSKRGMSLKRKTLFFDRGGYSKKCFSFLNQKKMYFVTYLKNRTKERAIERNKFEKKKFIDEVGEEYIYDLYEAEKKWIKGRSFRIIIFLGTDEVQIPIVTSNPFLKPESIIYFLKKRWREENCFKYMIEHFGIDLLTSYKTEEAPDKIITRPNPERVVINKEISKMQNDLLKLQSEFSNKLIENEIFKNETLDEVFKSQDKLKLKIKNLKMDIELLKIKRAKIKSKIQINLKDVNVIMAQKRRLFLNTLKVVNYNSEKWFQKVFQKFHAKDDEILSLIRNLFKHPGKIKENNRMMEVVLSPIHSRPIRRSVESVLENINKNSGIRLPDGRLLRIKITLAD